MVADLGLGAVFVAEVGGGVLVDAGMIHNTQV